MNIHQASYDCLMQQDLGLKKQGAAQLFNKWKAGEYTCGDKDKACRVRRVHTPGRPARPELVAPGKVKQRKLSTVEGRATLVHAIAHIEFNAINLALDAVYRFRAMPDEFYTDWLQVAAEEAHHFDLLAERLTQLGYEYGDMPAHNGLWESCVKTDHDVLVRMALVPRVLEARGLDVTPGMMEKLKSVGDGTTVEILDTILRDEIGHVRIGSRWFHYCCKQRNLEPEATFVKLINDYLNGALRGPFHKQARLQAGFTEHELESLAKLSFNGAQQRVGH